MILAQSELALMRERHVEEYRAALESCQRAGEQMKKVVNALLVLAELDAGDFDLQLGTHDLAEVIRGALTFMAPLAAERGHTLVEALQTVRVRMDADRMRSVLTNLLTNAMKHNPPGRTVRVSLSKEGRDAVIRVADDGCGISAEVLPKIFDRFVRGDAARSGGEGSTGLGLAITKAIVEAHGGSLSVTSDGATGSEFVVRLLAADEDDRCA